MPRPKFPQAPTKFYDERNEREFRRLVEINWPEADEDADGDVDGGFAESFQDVDLDGGQRE